MSSPASGSSTRLHSDPGRDQRSRLRLITDHFSLITRLRPAPHRRGYGVASLGIRAYGLGAGVGRGLADGPGRAVGDGLGVDVGVAVAVGVAVGVRVALGLAVAVGVGVPPPVGNTRTK